MKAWISDQISNIRSSYWYTPFLMVLIAAMLSYVSLTVDTLIPSNWLYDLGWFHPNNPDGARALLSTIASSLITVAGVIFSMTIVAVSFAASKIGPHIISNFMRDRSTQLSLGVFIASFLYALLILRAILNTGSEGIIFVPQLSLLIAMIFAILCIFVLIYFVHHIPDSINLPNVLSKIGEQLYQQADRLFPVISEQNNVKETGSIPEAYHQHVEDISANFHGYIRVINIGSILSTAKTHDVIIQLIESPGFFATDKSTIMRVYSKSVISEELARDCRNCLAYGAQRNQDQDSGYHIHLLVEIIARSMSPSMNEPFVAITSMKWLQQFLEKIADKAAQPAYHLDTDSHLRLIYHPPDFAHFCDLIFPKIMPYVCKDRNAGSALYQIINQLIETCDDKEKKLILKAHADALKKSADDTFKKELNNL